MSNTPKSVHAVILSAIPWVLGLGASVWFGVYMTADRFADEKKTKERRAEAVGAPPVIEAPFEIVVKPSKHCIYIERAEFNGKELVIYTVNSCKVATTEDYMLWRFKLVSPDGTILLNDYYNTGVCAKPMEPGDRAECEIGSWKFNKSKVERASKLTVWLEDQ